MAEKSMIAEQEAMLLQQKATEAENELQVLIETFDDGQILCIEGLNSQTLRVKKKTVVFLTKFKFYYVFFTANQVISHQVRRGKVDDG